MSEEDFDVRYRVIASFVCFLKAMKEITYSNSSRS